MSISLDQIKALRDKTGVSITACKKALEEANGDEAKAVELLRKKGEAKAAAREDRSTHEGVIAYSGNYSKVVIMKLLCETDFVAKTEGFSELAHNLAMQIAATNPISLDKETIDDKLVSREKKIFTEQAKEEGKPDDIIPRMVEGRLNKFFQENCLLEQAYIKDPDKKVNDLLTESIATLGENISINRFVRFSIGESDPTNGQV